MLRLIRLIFLFLVGSFALLANVTQAQVPVSLQEQLRLFETLSPAEQQAIVRQMQDQLPPTERDAILRMLQQQTNRADEEGLTFDSGAEVIVGGTTDISGESSVPHVLEPADTLIVDFSLAQSAGELAESLVDREVLSRLQDGNPYVLDGDGRLLLPGVPPVFLGGLNVEQATALLSVQRELRLYEISLTYLPLAPLGPAALEPFGYEVFRDSQRTFGSQLDIPVPVSYVMGPGDVINVQLFGSRNQRYSLEVSRDGTIDFPEIGPLVVSGLAFEDLRALVAAQVESQMIDVRASVTLGELRSISVFVVGDIKRPGTYSVSALSTMMNALIRSGGVTDVGSLRKILLRRDGETVTELDLYDLLLEGNAENDIRLMPDDVILVQPIGGSVAIDGAIRRPAIYEIVGGETVADLVRLAGGLAPGANPGSIIIERIIPGQGVSVIEVGLDSGSANEQVLADGDVIRVDSNIDRLETAVRLEGNVQREGLYQWFEGMTVADMLPGPVSVKPMSDLRYVLVRREAIENVETEVFSLDLQAVWQSEPGAENLALLPRDVVYVLHTETGRHQYVEGLLEELNANSSPRSSGLEVRIGGQVRRPGRYPLEAGMKISDLLRAGGGLLESAYETEAELIRYQVIDGEYREAEMVSVDLRSILAGMNDADLVLAAYDFVNIHEISGWQDQELVTLSGEVRFPGEYPISKGETLQSVLARAGGLTQFAFAEGSVFLRESAREREEEQLEILARRLEAQLAAGALADGGSSSVDTGQDLVEQIRSSVATGRTVIRLDSIIDGSASTTIALQDGDQLFVPERRQEVTLIGEVQNPITILFEEGMTRNDYIDRAGGLTRRADKNRVYVVRANGEVVTDGGVRWFNRAAQFEMRPGDTIVAPLAVERMRPLELWSSVTQIIYNLAISAAAVNSF